MFLGATARCRKPLETLYRLHLCKFSRLSATILAPLSCSFRRSNRQVDTSISARLLPCYQRQSSAIFAMTSHSSNGTWSNRSFEYTRPPCLPLDFRSEDGTTLTVDYASVAEVTSSLSKMASEAAARGDNVGVDEMTYKSDRTTQFAEIFTAKWKSEPVKRKDDSDSIAAFIVIGPSSTSGTVDSCLADVHVIRSRDVSDVTYGGLVRHAVQLSRQLDIGYTDCVMSVATSCDNLLRVLRRVGFTTVVTVPSGVNMADIGLVDSMLMVTNLCLIPRPPRSEDEVMRMLENQGIVDGPASDAEFQRVQLPQMSFLPQQYKFRSGLTVNVRNLRVGDEEPAWRMLKASADQGDGYALHCAPNLSSFRRSVATKYSAVLEDPATGEMIGWCNISRSMRLRTTQTSPDSSASRCILHKRYQNRGNGREFLLMVVAMTKELGYRQIINSYLSANVRTQKSGQGLRATVIGLVPHSGYIVGHGWVDLFVTAIDITSDSVPTFTQMAESSRAR